MSKARILYLEDEADIAEWIVFQLNQGQHRYDVTVVSDRPAFERILTQQSFDLFLIDYVVPDLDGLTSINMIRLVDPHAPVVMISGYVDEETLVNALRHGANDYVVKHNLQRLVPAIERALQESTPGHDFKDAVQSLHDNQFRLATLAERIPGGIYEFVQKPDGGYALPFVSNHFQKMMDIDAESVMHDASPVFSRVLAEDIPGLMSSISDSAKNLSQWSYEFRFTRSAGEILYFRGKSLPTSCPDGSIHWAGILEDITESRRA